LLDALLHAIDAVLSLRALARKHLALPLLHNLLSLLDVLLTLLRTLFDPRLSRRPRAQGWRCARARWCGDVRRRTPRYGWTLWRRSRATMDVGPAEIGS
jgi:hypothetical protein